MATIAGRRPLLTTLAETPRRQFLLGLAAGVAAMAPVLVADIAIPGHTAITSALIVGPFAAALAGGLAPAMLLVAATLALGALSGEWNHNVGAVDYWIRFAILGVGGGLALLIAWLRERSRGYSGRLELLSQIGGITDGSLSLADTLEHATELIVPAAADLALVDAIYRGEVTRAAVRVRGRADWQALETGLRSRAPSVPFWLRDPDFGIPLVPQFFPRVTAGHVEILSHGEADQAFLASLGMRSALTVPMIARGRLLGTLTVAVAWSKRTYGDDDLAFLGTLAGRLALALDNAGLFSDLESVERRMDAVMDLIPEAVTVHDARGALVFANQAAASLIGMDTAEEVLRSRTTERVALYELYTEDGERLPDDDLVEQAVQGGGLPLRGTYKLVVRETRAERWIAASVERISGPDGNLLYAVTTIEDVTVQKRAELAQRLLARVGELLQSSRDYGETLRRAAELAVPEFADWCAVSVPGDNGTIELVAVAHQDRERLALARRLADRYRQAIDGPSLIARVLRGGEPVMIDVGDEILRAVVEDGEHLDELRAIGLGSAILVPMVAGAKVVGVLTVINDRGSRSFDDADLELAAEFGRRAGLAAENARVAELEIQINTTLQRGLLPPDLPSMPGWQVATMYRPAGELNEVGGDFYEALEIEGGWMIVLGDVVGRGAEAAALTALARHTLYTAGSLTGDPLQALAMLNRRLRECDPIPLCSAAAIVLSKRDADAAEAIAVAAGHPLPLRVRGSEVTEAATPGPLLGALAEPTWTTSRIELQPQDQLIVYTDGVTDARSGDELFGEGRLRRELAGSGRPEAAVAKVELALSSFVGGEVSDDAALVAIMRESTSVIERVAEARRGEPAPA